MVSEMADIYYCPNKDCPHRVWYREAYYTEFGGRCPFCGRVLVRE